MSIIDRILAFIGLALTLWQLYRTKTAAQAGSESAAEGVSAIRSLDAAIKMHDISSRSKELLGLLKGKILAPAASAASELRDSVARYRQDHQNILAVDASAREQAVFDVGRVHERLESLAMEPKNTTGGSRIPAT